MLKALIFDVDGTLAETEEAHREAFNRAFAEANLGWQWDQPLYRKLLEVTGGKERIRHFIETVGPACLPSGEGANLDDAIAALHRRKTTIYNQIVASGELTLRPGVEALLRAARNDGVRLAIATTTSLPNVESLLAATLGEDANLFEVIAAGDQVRAKKPAPDVFLLALKRLGLAAEVCLALEDSVNGLKSARGAGLSTVVTISAYTSHQLFPHAAAVAPTLVQMAGSEDGATILQVLRDRYLEADRQKWKHLCFLRMRRSVTHSEM